MKREAPADSARRWMLGQARAAAAERALKREAGLNPARAMALSLELIEAAWSVARSEEARSSREREDAPVRELWRRARRAADAAKAHPRRRSAGR